jgi:hypothetical protein
VTTTTGRPSLLCVDAMDRLLTYAVPVPKLDRPSRLR